MAITTEDIHRAADELDSEGIRPTLAAVRKRVGSGSFTTISEGMAAWRNSKAVSAPAPEPLPDAVAERIAALGADVWAAATSAAHARVAAERESLSIEREKMEAERADAVDLANAVTAELDEYRARAAADAEQLRAALAKAEAQIDAEREAAETQRAMVDRLREERAGLGGQLRAVEAERDRVAADLAAAQQEIGRLRK